VNGSSDELTQGSSQSKFGSVYLTQLTCQFQIWNIWEKIANLENLSANFGEKQPINA